jgi:hypothetical protein
MILPFTVRDSVRPRPLTGLANVVDAGQRAFKNASFLVMDALDRRCRHATYWRLELLLTRCH